MVSMPISTLASSMQPPNALAITSRAVELKWAPIRDRRYGTSGRYTLTGKIAGSNRFFILYSGKGSSCVVQSIDNVPLVPNTTYVFRISARTSVGEIASKPMPLTTSPAPPEAPLAPIAVVVTSSTITLRAGNLQTTMVAPLQDMFSMAAGSDHHVLRGCTRA